VIRFTGYFQLSNSRATGWSENYWRDGSEFNEAAFNAAKTLYSNLAYYKGHEVIPTGYKLTMYGEGPVSTGVSWPFPVASVPTSNPSTGVTLNADYPTTAIQIQGNTGTQRANFWFHGVIDQNVGFGGVFTSTGLTWFTNFCGDLAAGGWGLRVRNKTASPKRFISGYSNETNLFVTTADHGFAVDDYVQIHRMGSSDAQDSINGQYRVSSVPTSKTFSVIGLRANDQDHARVVKGAYVRKAVWHFQACQWKPIRVTSRQVGSPSNRVRGRSRNRPNT